MKEENMFDDSIVDSLRQLTPDVPPETKSRLLYECGMAAAETKMKMQRRRFRTNASLSLLIATGVGFFIGHSFQNTNQSPAVATQQQLTDQIEIATPRRNYVHTQDMTKLAAATPINRVFELLERETESPNSLNAAPSMPVQPPLSTLSFLNGFE